MKYLILILSLFVCTLSKAQWLWDYGGTLGVSNYLGDIGGKEGTRKDFAADLKMASTRLNVGGFARYKLRRKISVKAALDYLRIQGDDKLSANKARNARNLSFRNDIIDLGFTGEYFFFEDNDLGNTYRNQFGFRAYVFGGFGVFYTNPKALYNGSYVSLRPLKTEGVSYSPIGLNLPLGVGFYFTIMKKHRIGFEINNRITFTDYLDDVSNGWGDPKNMTPEGVALSNRTVELTNLDPNYAKNFGYNPETNPLNKRGDKNHNDSYLTMSLSYSYVLRGKSSFYRGNYGHFFEKGKKNKVRSTIRSKF